MSPDGKLTFGPLGDQWVYDKSTKTYDLTRGNNSSSSPLKIQTTQGPPDTNILITPSQAVLVIIDMQNFFLHPSCRPHPDGLAAVTPLLTTIEHCRKAGIQVVWLNWGLKDADLAAMPAGVSRGFAKAVIAADENETATAAAAAGLGVDLGDGKGRCLVAGEWNAEIYAPLAEAVLDGDVHCAKNRMSGLWCEGQPLWRCLSGMGEGDGEGDEGKKKKTLLFAGVNTDQCVLGTLTDAYNAGWDCVLKNYGFVIDSRTFAEAS
ncbi:Peroxyureidoacrylate/ureidoacrylate amidohydrolase RutB [Cytospora mali]|uniref:Peroxyureidoacrylate/ureidoacrylate amidohydrolase RutB n=1 Tax=Cytospora mali TaxID=578113 RepID=A0A194V9D8_CYTMA|nr:Peroxyureidoacrylate/ureidoacrylate amidohydrolase RutB [Valsa mali var. pyri (nom. inval.)]